MALETGVTYIDDLVETNPVGATDNIDEGDDHIRNIKTAVKGSFPNLGDAAVTKTAAQINSGQEATVPATANNLAMLDASGDLTDSLVESDGSGNITANVTGNITGNVTGDVTGDLTGNADTATTAVSVTGTAVITALNLAGNCVQDSEIFTPSAGSAIVRRVLSSTEERATTGTSYVSNTTFTESSTNIHLGTVLASGTIRITLQMKTTAGTAYARVVTNSTASADITTTGTSFTTKTKDIAVIVGDLVRLQIKADSGRTCTIRNLSVTVDSGNLVLA